MGIIMEDAIPYVGMIIVQFAQVGLMMAGKIAIANGMTTFTFTFYSNAVASLILLPVSFFIYRSTRPPLFFTFLCGFFLLGFIGFLVQIFGYAGLKYASAALSTSMLNLIPGFTFILAVILRMEKFNVKSSTTVAKCIGTIVTIVGAVIVTLYQGPAIFRIPQNSDNPFDSITSSSTWLLGGLLLAIDCIISAIFIIAQALVLKKCPTELILMCFYSCFITILSASTSLVIEKDLSAWSLKSKMRLLPVIYSGLFGNVFQVSIIMWCVRRRGPLFASIFHPLGVVLAIATGIIVLGETFYLGTLLGSIVVVAGFYSVMWGKSKEAKKKIEDTKEPLLHNNTENVQV